METIRISEDEVDKVNGTVIIIDGIKYKIVKSDWVNKEFEVVELEYIE